MAMRHVVPLIPLTLLGCVAQVPPVEGLTGSEWRITSIDGTAPAVPDRARLSFEAGRLSANVGCNAMGGPWRLEEGRLIAGPLAQTKMFCAGTVGEQELAASALLVAAPEVTFEGERLILRSAGHEVLLERSSND